MSKTSLIATIAIYTCRSFGLKYVFPNPHAIDVYTPTQNYMTYSYLQLASYNTKQKLYIKNTCSEVASYITIQEWNLRYGMI